MLGKLHAQYFVRSPLANITACKSILEPAESLSDTVLFIFAHSSIQKSFRFVRFFFAPSVMLSPSEIFPQIFHDVEVRRQWESW